jgi:quercetin dioxygenase-like cupin family protein
VTANAAGDHQNAIATRWADLPIERVRPGVQRCAIGTPGVTAVMNYIDPHMQPAPHRHDDFDQIAIIVSGEATYHVGDAANRVGPGSVLLIPAGVEHWIEPRGTERVENLDLFAPARADYAHLLAWMSNGPEPTEPAS